VHRAKGAEADYVVILSVTSGRTGFPSEIADDPLLSFVLAEDEGYANAEERRLFYVALSRARYKAYVITDAGRISAFVEELWRAQYSDLVMPSFRDVKAPTCNKCQGGPMRSVSGPHGEFVSCTHYPLCDGKCVVCPRCGKSGLQPDKGTFVCFHCESPVAKCPKCKVGYLKRFPPGTSKKTGKSYLEFWGCSTYRTGVPGACNYSQPWNPNY
jgi:DNA helicase-4